MLQAGLSCCRKPRILLMHDQDLLSQMRIFRVYKFIEDFNGPVPGAVIHEHILYIRT